MKKAILSSLVASALSLTTMGTVAAEETNNKKLNPWADCGIGAMIFTSNGGAAAISNIIWDLGTTAVSSNISSQESCESERAKTAMFIKATKPALEQEIAIGEGEYVTAMLETRGCVVASHNDIISAIREELTEKPSQSAQDLYNTVESQVQSNFAAACASV